MSWPEELERITENLKGPPSEPAKATDGGAFASDVLGVFTDGPRLGTGLNVVGAVLTAIGQYQESPAQSTVFKTTDAVTAGMMDWAIGSAAFSTNPAAAANPLVAVADFALGAVTKEVLGAEISVSSMGNGAAHALNTFVDGVISWDEQGMQSFHEKSLNGDYGLIIQGWSMIGEVISQNYELHPAVVNTLQPFDFDEIRARYEASQPKVPSLRLGE